MPNSRIFGLEFENINFDVSNHRICLVAKFGANIYLPYFGLFGLEFEKIVLIFEISTLKFV